MKAISTILFSILIFGIASTNAFAQPPNDHISDARDLFYGPIPLPLHNVDFPNATSTGDITPASGCELSQAGIWYKFTAEKAGNVTAGIVNPNGAAVIFFEGPANVADASQLTYVNQPNNNPCAAGSSANIQTIPGATYYLYMRNLVTSEININVEGAYLRPGNDLIVNATDVNGFGDYADLDVHFAMATDTDDEGQINCSTGAGKGIWYKFTAQNNGTIFAMVASNPSASLIIFYSAQNENATSGADLTFVDQPTNVCTWDNNTSIDATAGTTYYLFVASTEGYANVNMELSTVMGTSENTLEGFEFYPNPVVDELNLSARSIVEEVKIYNIQGKKVYSGKIGTKKSRLDLGKLSSGLYIMEVLSEGTTTRYKLVKK